MSDFRTAVLTAPRTFEIRDIPKPALRPNELLIEVDVAGVCGTDVEIWEGRLSEFALPLVMGHEIVGTVIEGSRRLPASRVDVGDQVIVEASVACGGCLNCRLGFARHCSHGGSYGLRTGADVAPGLWGGFGEAVFVPPTVELHPLPDGVSAEEATMVTSVVANGIGWVCETGACRLGDTVLIFGAGPQAISCAAAASASGATLVIMVGLSADTGRLEIAKSFGVDETLMGDIVDVATAVMDLTGGAGADLVVDVAGSPATPQAAIDAAALRGRIVHASQMGTHRRSELVLDTLVRKELTIHGVLSKGPSAIGTALALTSEHRFPFVDLITDRFTLDHIEEAFEAFTNPGTRPVKAIIAAST